MIHVRYLVQNLHIQVNRHIVMNLKKKSLEDSKFTKIPWSIYWLYILAYLGEITSLSISKIDVRYVGVIFKWKYILSENNKRGEKKNSSPTTLRNCGRPPSFLSYMFYIILVLKTANSIVNRLFHLPEKKANRQICKLMMTLQPVTP